MSLENVKQVLMITHVGHVLTVGALDWPKAEHNKSYLLDGQPHVCLKIGQAVFMLDYRSVMSESSYKLNDDLTRLPSLYGLTGSKSNEYQSVNLLGYVLRDLGSGQPVACKVRAVFASANAGRWLPAFEPKFDTASLDWTKLEETQQAQPA